MESNEKQKTAKERLDEILDDYLVNNPLNRYDRKTSEIELRFGSNKQRKSISKIDYDNVAQQLYNYGFKSENPNGFYSLRINHEYYDYKAKLDKMSNIRTEIEGLDLIQKYCETNSIQKLFDMPSVSYEKINFTQKMKPRKNDKPIHPADFEEFNMRISYQLEQSYDARSQIIRDIIDNWNDRKKTFRLLNRVRFVHDELPVFADLSIVKYGKTTNNTVMKVYSIQDSEIFDQEETYDIEIELNNMKIGGPGSKYNSVKSITDLIRKSMRIVLSGLQQTNYPISYNEQENILHEYLQLLHGKQYEKPKNVYSSSFIGPMSYPLEIKHIMEESENNKLPNIRKNYTVTDKADGDRNLLFINREGKIYLINSNMDVMFTGSKIDDKGLYESLLDGEHIRYDKKNKFINLYAAFDVYYIKDKSTRDLPFSISEGDELLEKKPEYRLNLLSRFIEKLQLKNVTNSEGPCEFNIVCKKFAGTSKNTSIFDGCFEILSKIDDGIYEYETDGLVFTPSDKCVGSDDNKTAGPLSRITWDYSFKWKPLEFLTIDLLVDVKKNKKGEHEIHNIFEDGIDITKDTNIKQYKTLILRCGYNEKKHGYLNPFNDIIEDKTTTLNNLDSKDAYSPVPFLPTNPYNAKACYANVLLQKNGNDYSMFTENNEYFDENTIVEFRYDLTRGDGWKWVPLRVRYDKTAQLRSKNPKQRNYGNAYHVANSNWQCIHNPITKDMITKGENIPDYLEFNGDEVVNDMDEGIYYNKKGIDNKKSKSMRDFHNLYVKSKLIGGVSNRDDTLIDYAVGRAGDLHKWIKNNLKFVFGIDKSKDCINNRINGACVRYLQEKKTKKKITDALFINGDSGCNIRNGSAFKEPNGTIKEKEIANAVFGNGPKDETFLGKGVFKQYGVATNGFNISSCQFALHYFFENKTTLNNFVRNLSECTLLDGYFIGCCYDGESVFKLLSKKNKGESVILNDGSHKMYEMKKLYDQTGFPDDETSLGYCINVFQDSIGNDICEYLVNFNYFIRIMENYGFTLLSEEEVVSTGLTSSTGMFEELFNAMEIEININKKVVNNYKNANKMTSNEKFVSFLNRYFIFRKRRNVDAEKIMKKVLSKDIEIIEEPEEKESEDEDEPKKNKQRVRIKKRKDDDEPVKKTKIVIKKKK